MTKTVPANTRNSRQKISAIIGLVERKGLVCPLEEETSDKGLEEFLFPKGSVKGHC